MLLAIEGPDCSGKTTLFNQLKLKLNARFVPRLPMPEPLLPFIQLVDDRQIALWDAIYDERQLYVCDRSPFVSGPAYEMFRGNCRTVPSEWRERVVPVYLCVPEEELVRRFAERGDEWFPGKFDRLLECYKTVLQLFSRTIILDGMLPTSELVAQLTRHQLLSHAKKA